MQIFFYTLQIFLVQVINVLPELHLSARSTALIPPGQVRATILR